MGRGFTGGHWLLAAVVLSCVNIIKPLHVDDVIWVHFAQHIAQAPTDPFGFTMPWGYGCIPAIEMWSPPVLPYWWGAGVALLGQSPVLWKAWLFPFALIFSAAAFALARRFAPVWGVPVGYAITLAPTVLPAVNLMQDIPAAAFVLAALALTLAGCARHSFAMALLGGICLGLACLTKWSALSGFGVIGVACLMFAPNWRWCFAIPAAGLAIFAGWEAYLFVAYGQSNFLLSVAGHGPPDTGRIKGLMIALVTYTGALAPFVAVAGLGAMGAGRSVAIFIAGLFGAAILALALWPEPLGVINPMTGRNLRLDTPVLAGLGVLVWSGLGLSVVRALRHLGLERQLVFLILWFGLELAGYFILSPFPAARRFVTLLAAMTLLVAAAVAPRVGRGTIQIAVGAHIAMGLLFAVVDQLDAQRIKSAAARTLALETAPPTGQLWAKGVFGFNHYVADLGAKLPCATDTLRPGDRLAVYDVGVSDRFRNPTFAMLEDTGALHRLGAFSERPALPLTTMGEGYYLGRRPIEGVDGALHGAVLFEVRRAIPWDSVAPR